MASFERLEPRSGDMPTFDGHEETEDEAEEASRLPLLIVIALLVLAAFAGVVWLAYTQGVERGRADAPRVVEAQPAIGSSAISVQKMYQQPAATDAEADKGEAPTPTPAIKATPPSVATHTTVSTAPRKIVPVTGSEAPANKVALSAPPQPSSKPVANFPESVPVPKPLPAEPTKPTPSATHAPAMLGQQTSENSTAEVKPVQAQQPAAASIPAPASASAAGSYFLQIGSYKSQGDADAAWRSFKANHPTVASYQSNVKEADLGEKGVWYRLRIGAFSDKTSANAVCSKLKAEGASCFPAK
jgi:hypothetical protein